MKQRDLSTDEIVLLAQQAATETVRRALFNDLVLRYQKPAHHYAYSLLHDEQLAEDVVQESFLAAYRALPQLRAPRAFSVWLQRIVRSHCRQVLQQERLKLQSLDQLFELSDGQPSPQTSLEDAEMQHDLKANIAALPHSQQAPVTLYYWDDYSQAEIASALGLSISAVKKRLERARVQLEGRMQDMAAEYLHMQPEDKSAVGLFTTLMNAAAVEGQGVLLETLLVEGMNVDEQDAKGWTLLHWAANDGNLEAVELLLHYAADTTLRDHTGRTPLQFAVEGRHSTIAKVLRQAAAQS